MIAREGYPFITVAALVLAVVLVVPKIVIVIVLLLLLALFVYFFRDPERDVPNSDQVAVSAADGRIVEVSEVEMDGGTFKKVSVFMNVFNVHVNRMPFAGTIVDVTHIPGRFVPADKPEASTENERNKMTVDTRFGRMYIIQVAGLVARRCVAYVKPGDTMGMGERIGLIKFSSRVDHYFPISFDIAVKLGDKVTAGESVLARVSKPEEA